MQGCLQLWICVGQLSYMKWAKWYVECKKNTVQHVDMAPRSKDMTTTHGCLLHNNRKGTPTPAVCCSDKKMSWSHLFPWDQYPEICTSEFQCSSTLLFRISTFCDHPFLIPLIRTFMPGFNKSLSRLLYYIYHWHFVELLDHNTCFMLKMGSDVHDSFIGTN